MGSVITGRNKASVVVLAQQLIAGTNKHLPATTQVMVGGASYTQAEITSQLQAIVTLRSDVTAAKATTDAKLAAEKAGLPALRTFTGAFVAFVKAMFGNAPDVLADFGLTPRAAPTPPTIDAKAAAVAKRASTRAARHTMGSEQKKSVTGTVSGVVITPISSAPPAATPSKP